jgi:perosamine synthetase
MYNETINFIRECFNEPKEFIPLHEPRFWGNEKKYINEAIDSTFVSSVGAFVDKFEVEIAKITGAKYAVATVNGTAALHIALLLAGVKPNEEVITQSLTFVATANAIAYAGASCVFVDVDKSTLGLSAEHLEKFLKKNVVLKDGKAFNKTTSKFISACLPMHTFGFMSEIEEIVSMCSEYNINVVEDAAESLGSYKGDKHSGTFGLIGTLSLNGNKTITSGGGGAILTNDKDLAVKAKHITTTAKQPHRWDYEHHELAYNYRMPNLNAALACAQLEMLPEFLVKKRKLANLYSDYFKNAEVTFQMETPGTTANYWLNTLILKDYKQRQEFLTSTNDAGVMTRPIWKLMHKLPMYKSCFHDDLSNSIWLENRVVNIPSSVIKSL